VSCTASLDQASGSSAADFLDPELAVPGDESLYDPESRMRLGFLAQLSAHLESGGEGWLILSDLAEHLGLRTRAQLIEEFAAAGLLVVGRHDAAPRHPRAADASDPLHVARAAEITSLWRLAPR
jgi:hypothetical protein